MKYARNKDIASQSRLGNTKPAKNESKKQTVLQSFESELDAEIARAHLEAECIQTSIIKDDAGGMFPSLQQTGGVRLLVDDAALTKAKAILRKKLR